jgi:hypothetical protein
MVAHSLIVTVNLDRALKPSNDLRNIYRYALNIGRHSATESSHAQADDLSLTVSNDYAMPVRYRGYVKVWPSVCLQIIHSADNSQCTFANIRD